jgi:23S rRNA pseudouridine1911/1915/1917 synthase
LNTLSKDFDQKEYSFQYSKKKSDSERIDYFLAKKLNIPRNQIQKSIELNKLKCNGKVIRKPSFLLSSGDVIDFEPFIEEKPELTPEKIDIDYIHKDKDILLINKSAGIIVHPGIRNPNHTLLNGILNDFPEIKNVGDPQRPGIVHRLDKETSGILIVARNNRSFESLSNMFKSREIHKEYVGLVNGIIKPKEGIINSPIARHPTLKIKQAIVKNGKKSITKYETIKNIKTFSLLRIQIFTGRMHQIRVHLSSIGHPILGDSLYGKKTKILNQRHFLHANKIIFTHPITKYLMEFKSDLPKDLKTILNNIEKMVKFKD